MPRRIRKAPADVDLVGLNRLVEIVEGLKPDGPLFNELNKLKNRLKRTRVGEKEQSAHIPHNLNFLTELAAKDLERFLLIITELYDQSLEYLDQIEAGTKG